MSIFSTYMSIDPIVFFGNWTLRATTMYMVRDGLNWAWQGCEGSPCDDCREAADELLEYACESFGLL